MGTKQSKEDSIIIEPAGTGSNMATQEGIIYPHWMVTNSSTGMYCSRNNAVHEKQVPGRQKLVRREIHRNKRQRSQADITSATIA